MLPESVRAKLKEMVNSACSQSVVHLTWLAKNEYKSHCYLESQLGRLLGWFDIEFQRALRKIFLFLVSKNSTSHVRLLFDLDTGMFQRVGGVPG